jgi:hypothetical protein
MDQASDRRAAPRVPFRSNSIVRTRSEEFVCRSLNLSTSGMLVSPPPSAQPSRSMRVNFFSAVRNEWLGVDVELARKTAVDGRPAWGLQFKNLDEPAMRMLRGLVASSMLRRS